MPRTRSASPAALVISMMTAWCGLAHAEPAPPHPLSLTEAIAQARANRPAVREALARVRAQMKAADEPRAQWLPTVGATAQIFGATASNTTGTYVGTAFVDI